MHSAEDQAILDLASRHGLKLTGKLSINDQGLDFRTVVAEDHSGQRWILRIPRREDVLPKVEYERRVLDLVKANISVPVPDWKIVTQELITYPMLSDPTGLSFDPVTYEVTWNMDQGSQTYLQSLAHMLVELHSIRKADIEKHGLRIIDARSKMEESIEIVQKELGIGPELYRQWKEWIANDDLWPRFSTLVHGDLYAGHVTVDSEARITGIIDWTEAEFNDPTIDFTGHLAAFGEESLSRLVSLYESAGGKTWPSFIEQVKARHSASPLRYALFAIESRNEQHIQNARAQLGLS